MEKRMMELEIKVEYHEKTIGELNEVVLRQQQQIERLEKQLAAMKQLVAAGAEEEDAPDQPPPHY